MKSFHTSKASKDIFLVNISAFSWVTDVANEQLEYTEPHNDLQSLCLILFKALLN